jgi:DNA-binding NtrC family response regulator
LGKILVVDDEPEVVEVLDDLLTANHHVVRTAGSVEAALALLLIELPQVEILVSDIRMPSNGHVLVPEVVRLYPDIAIVMMTGFAAGREHFSWPVLHKPFRMVVLLKAVDDAMQDRAKRVSDLLAARGAAN